MFVRGNPFQPSLIFVSKAGNIRVKRPLGAPLYGRLLLALLDISAEWKGLQGTNTLAYCKNS
jgi:hypothetical protein